MARRRAAPREVPFVGRIVPDSGPSQATSSQYRQAGWDEASGESDGEYASNDTNEDLQFLNFDEMNDVGQGSTFVTSGGRPGERTVKVVLDDGSDIDILGRFWFKDPWWKISGRTQIYQKKVYLVGDPVYELAENKTSVCMFLDSCVQNRSAEGDLKQRFLDFLRIQDQIDGLKFSNLNKKLDFWKQHTLPEGESEVVETLRRSITSSVNGRIVNFALECPTLFYYLPRILPNNVYGILYKKSDGPDLMQKFKPMEEVIKTKPWVFGFKPILQHEYNIIACEANLANLKESGLFNTIAIPEHQNKKNALQIYNVLKRKCRDGRHTYLFDPDIRKFISDISYQMLGRGWDEAYRYLDKKRVTVRERGGRVYLERLWRHEKDIADGFSGMLNSSSFILRVDENSPSLQSTASDVDQAKAVKMISQNPITVISGIGGCSKTHVFSPKLRVSLNLKPSQILLTAPTGKAANLLGKRTGMKDRSFTLHQVIWNFMSHLKKKAGLKRENTKEDSGHIIEERWRHADVTCLVVDECSLVAVQTFSTVWNILKRETKLEKVVLLGDVQQLPSLEPGNFLFDVYKGLDAIGCSVTLRTNHRAESQLIVDNAIKISKGECPVFDKDRHFTRIDATFSQGKEIETVKTDVRNLLKSKTLLGSGIESDVTSQFIAFKRANCKAINNVCCRHYNHHEARTPEDIIIFEEGDKVCLTKNGWVTNRLAESGQTTEGATADTPPADTSSGRHSAVEPEKIRLCNGEIFFIEKIRVEEETNNEFYQLDDRNPDKEDRKRIEVEFKELVRECKMQHAWARTIHTFQGSESETIIYVVGERSNQDWQHAYTAVTRSRKKVYIVTASHILSAVVHTDPRKRQTSLREKLEESIQSPDRQRFEVDTRQPSNAAGDGVKNQPLHGFQDLGDSDAFPEAVNDLEAERSTDSVSSPCMRPARSTLLHEMADVQGTLADVLASDGIQNGTRPFTSDTSPCTSVVTAHGSNGRDSPPGRTDNTSTPEKRRALPDRGAKDSPAKRSRDIRIQEGPQ